MWYLFIDLLVDEGIAKLRYLKSYSTDEPVTPVCAQVPKSE